MTSKVQSSAKFKVQTVPMMRPLTIGITTRNRPRRGRALRAIARAASGRSRARHRVRRCVGRAGRGRSSRGRRRRHGRRRHPRRTQVGYIAGRNAHRAARRRHAVRPPARRRHGACSTRPRCERAIAVLDAGPGRRRDRVRAGRSRRQSVARAHAARPGPCSRRYVASFIGFAHLLRRDVFLRLGGYRESFVFYGEEKDYCVRALAGGTARRVSARRGRRPRAGSRRAQRDPLRPVRDPQRLPLLALQRAVAARRGRPADPAAGGTAGWPGATPSRAASGGSSARRSSRRRSPRPAVAADDPAMAVSWATTSGNRRPTRVAGAERATLRDARMKRLLTIGHSYVVGLNRRLRRRNGAAGKRSMERHRGGARRATRATSGASRSQPLPDEACRVVPLPVHARSLSASHVLRRPSPSDVRALGRRPLLGGAVRRGGCADCAPGSAPGRAGVFLVPEPREDLSAAVQLDGAAGAAARGRVDCVRPDGARRAARAGRLRARFRRASFRPASTRVAFAPER